jgi:hypothetical protein
MERGKLLSLVVARQEVIVHNVGRLLQFSVRVLLYFFLILQGQELVNSIVS